MNPVDDMRFWLQPAFPQYRKYVHDAAGNRVKDTDGEDKMTHLDGKETDKNEVMCFDYTSEWKKFLALHRLEVRGETKNIKNLKDMKGFVSMRTDSKS